MLYLPSEYRELPPLDLLSWLFDNNNVDPEKDVREALHPPQDWHKSHDSHRSSSMPPTLKLG